MYYLPRDLENLNFKKDLLYGYNKEQVNKIIAKIKDDYNTLYTENDEINKELAIMKETVKHYKTIEESLQHTLIIAQHTSENIKINASERAANIIKEAELSAQKIIDDANLRVAKINLEYEETKKSLNTYRIKSQSLINTLQEMFKQPFEEISE